MSSRCIYRIFPVDSTHADALSEGSIDAPPADEREDQSIFWPRESSAQRLVLPSLECSTSRLCSKGTCPLMAAASNDTLSNCARQR
jgi:hypothetical protein